MDVNLLKQAAIFQDLDDGELARVSEVCREQRFASGQHVFKEGEPGNRLFLIAEGEVRISRTIPSGSLLVNDATTPNELRQYEMPLAMW